MTMNPETLYLQLGHLLAEMPDLMFGQITAEERRWMARAHALIERSGDIGDAISFKVASDNLYGGATRQHNANQMINVVHRALARAELAAPANAHGQFIAAGDTLSAMAGVAKVLGSAGRSILLVDAYADHTLITDFAVTARDGVPVRILGADKEARKASLRPAAERWRQQFGNAKPLEVRVAPASHLHDRLILIDDNTVYVVGQSFNGMAQRSHTAIVKVDAELASQKVEAYSALWGTATAL